jgi:uncharacterized protein YjbI with pentapeptide repeats
MKLWDFRQVQREVRMKRFHPLKSNLQRPRLWLLIIGSVATVVLSKPMLWPGGFGIGQEKSVTTMSVEKDKQGNITKSIETTKIEDGKTLWDWLSVLGVPLSLAVLGYWLQQMQQKRAEEVAKEQREIAADETKEEVLQVYFDRLSVLLVDKNLLAIAAKVYPTESEGTESQPQVSATAEERELLDSAVDVIRARTLSILRRFENDPQRKTSVIRFLIEADIVSKLKLSLRGANLSGVNLSRANLRGANLRGADLGDAKLKGANFSGADLGDAYFYSADLSDANFRSADLSGADLSGADLSGANLRGAYLRGAYLRGAYLIDANLRYADLIDANLGDAKLKGADLSGADLSGAKEIKVAQLQETKLCQTELPPDITLNPNRNCQELGIPEN